MQNKYNFDDLVSGKIKDHESEFSDDAWKNMQAKLDSSEKKFPDRKARRNAFLLLLLVVTVSTAFIAGYLYNNSRNMSVSSRVISKKSETKGKKISDANHSSKETLALSANALRPSNDLQSASNSIASDLNSSSSGPGFVSSINHPQSNADHNNVSNESGKINNAPENQFSNHKDNKNASSVTDTGLSKTVNDISEKPSKDDQPEHPKNTDQKLLTKNDKVIEPISNRHSISFGPYLGFNGNFTYSQQNQTSQSSFDYSIGAFINYPIGDKISLQSGLGYSMMTDLIFIKSDTVLVENDMNGKVYQVTQKSTADIEYLHLPVVLKYKISPKFRILIGAQFSYALSAPLYVNTTNYKKDQNGNYTLVNPADTNLIARSYTNVSNFNNDVSRFNVQLQTGIQWDMSKSFDLSFMYFIGLTNTLKNTDGYIYSLGNDNNSMLQLRIGYKLFHKKFHED